MPLAEGGTSWTMCIRLDIIPECDRQTDTQTYRRTDGQNRQTDRQTDGWTALPFNIALFMHSILTGDKNILKRRTCV